MERIVKLLIFSGIFSISISNLVAEPFPFADGMYVTDISICRSAENFGDEIANKVRNISGDQLDNGYELSCKVKNVRRHGSRVLFDAFCEAEGEEQQIGGSYEYVSERAFRLRGTLFQHCSLASQQPEAQYSVRASVDELIELWSDSNDRCRGGSGDDPRTYGACAAREEYQHLLRERDWCYGKESEAGYQMKWHRCDTDSLRD